jgi:hypothetical protein
VPAIHQLRRKSAQKPQLSPVIHADFGGRRAKAHRLLNTPAQLLLASISRDVSGVDVRSYGLVDQSIPPKVSVRCRSVGGFCE